MTVFHVVAWTRLQTRVVVVVDGGGGDTASAPGSSSGAEKKVVVLAVAKRPTKDRHTKVDGHGQ
jgi:hypothetical protein